MAIMNREPEKPFSHLEVLPGGGQAEHESYGKKPAYFEPDQLYDLKNDPGEMNNLANDSAYADVLAHMKSILEGFIDELPGKFEL
jgi:hypothetical protein